MAVITAGAGRFFTHYIKYLNITETRIMGKTRSDKNVEKYSLINTGRIGISLLFLFIICFYEIKYPVIFFSSITHLAFSVLWFALIQFDIFIEENHVFSGYIPCTLDVLVCTAFILVTGNIYSPMLITYVIITSLTSVVIHKYISLYATVLITVLYIAMGVTTVRGYLPNINLFSDSVIMPTYFLLCVSTLVLGTGLFIVRNIVQQFVKNNSDLYKLAEREKKITEKLLEELQNNYRVIEERNCTMNRDLQLARSIQLSLIPDPPGHLDGIVISAIYHPMHEVGGDFYDFIYFKETKNIGIFISDVSGHGIPAALITSMLKALINTAGKERTIPDNLLTYINNNLYDQTNQNFITAIYAIYDSSERTLTFSRAGHPPIILLRGDSIEYISGKGGPLAIKETVSFEVKTVQLHAGDKVLLVTDGLLEATGRNGENFDQTALLSAISVHKNLPLKIFINMLFSELVDFHGNSSFDDDICIVGFEVC